MTKRYLILGDIHGEIDKIRAYAPYFTQVDQVILVGDYVDRGPDSLGVLKYVQTIPNCIRLTGNHEAKYVKKIYQKKLFLPSDVPLDKATEFSQELMKVVGEKQHYWYKDDNLGVSHAPAALWQHNWYAITPDKYIYAWTEGKTDKGMPIRVPLSKVYPGEESEKPIIFGHIHSHTIYIGHNQYCVDLDCGRGGPLAGVIFEDSTLVQTIAL